MTSGTKKNIILGDELHYKLHQRCLHTVCAPIDKKIHMTDHFYHYFFTRNACGSSGTESMVLLLSMGFFVGGMPPVGLLHFEDIKSHSDKTSKRKSVKITLLITIQINILWYHSGKNDDYGTTVIKLVASVKRNWHFLVLLTSTWAKTFQQLNFLIWKEWFQTCAMALSKKQRLKVTYPIINFFTIFSSKSMHKPLSITFLIH